MAKKSGVAPILVVDSREPKTMDLRLAAAGFSVHRMKLDTGDYLWTAKDGRTVCVERKTVSDLLGSLAGKQANGAPRLKNQLGRLISVYDVPILLIEGTVRAGGDGKIIAGTRVTRWPFDGVDNLFLSLHASGVYIARCGTNRVPGRLWSLHQYFEKTQHEYLTESHVRNEVLPEVQDEDPA